MTEYEVLGLDQWDSKGFQSQTSTASESESAPVTASVTPEPTPPSTPSTPSTPSPPSPPPAPAAPEPPEEVAKGVQAASSSPQLRLSKRKAPEVHCQVNVTAQLLPDSNGPLRVATYSLIH